MMARVSEAPARASDPRERPIGVFDSGVGGLTVLHELLVALPHEDYLYLGDTARFPMASARRRSLRSSRWRSPRSCCAGARSCSSWRATRRAAAALPACAGGARRRRLGVDVHRRRSPRPPSAVAGDARRADRAAGHAATVASGAYEQAVHAVDPHVTLYAVPAPAWRASSRRGNQFDERAVETVRGPASRCARRKSTR